MSSFFFWSLYESLKANDSYYWFFNPPKQPPESLQKEQQKERQKQIKKNQRIAARIGHRYIYERLLESGVFNGYRATPHQSVRAIPANDALAEMSRENSKV